MLLADLYIVLLRASRLGMLVLNLKGLLGRCVVIETRVRVSKAATETWNFRVAGTSNFLQPAPANDQVPMLERTIRYVMLLSSYEMTSLSRCYNVVQLLPPTNNGPIKMALSEHTPCVTPQAGSSSFAFHQSASGGLPNIS